MSEFCRPWVKWHKRKMSLKAWEIKKKLTKRALNILIPNFTHHLIYTHTNVARSEEKKDKT